jgi:hypothetical protein
MKIIKTGATYSLGVRKVHLTFKGLIMVQAALLVFAVQSWGNDHGERTVNCNRGRR